MADERFPAPGAEEPEEQSPDEIEEPTDDEVEQDDT